MMIGPKRNSNSLAWHPADAVPQVPEGEMDTFILAVRRAGDGVVSRFAVDYLNRFPLWCEQPSLPGVDPRISGVEADGLSATGWFDHIPDEVNGAIVSPLYLNPGDRIVGWCPLPDFQPAP